AQLHGSLPLRLTPARRQNPRSHLAADCDGGNRDACAGPYDQHRLACAQPGAGDDHPPGCQKGQGEGGRFVPGERRRLRVDVLSREVEQLAGGTVCVLAEYAELRAEDLLTGTAGLALPAAADRVDDHLVAGLPALGTRLDNHTSPVGAKHTRWLNALGTGDQPEVEMVERRRPDRHSDLARPDRSTSALFDGDAAGPDGLPEHSDLPLAEYVHGCVS